MMKDKTNNCIMEPRHNNQNFFHAVEKTLKKKKAKIVNNNAQGDPGRRSVMTMLLFDSN